MLWKSSAVPQSSLNHLTVSEISGNWGKKSKGVVPPGLFFFCRDLEAFCSNKTESPKMPVHSIIIEFWH